MYTDRFWYKVVAHGCGRKIHVYFLSEYLCSYAYLLDACSERIFPNKDLSVY